jgi:hypothetical protein
VSGNSKPKKGKAAPRKARSKEKKTETIDDSPE